MQTYGTVLSACFCCTRETHYALRKITFKQLLWQNGSTAKVPTEVVVASEPCWFGSTLQAALENALFWH